MKTETLDEPSTLPKPVVGSRSGRLVLVKPSWICPLVRCDCGKELLIPRQADFLRGRYRSCGAQACNLRKDLTGRRFGKLVVTRLSSRRTNARKTLWVAKCDCGSEVVVQGQSLTSGNTKSCGCLRYKVSLGMSKTHACDNSGRWLPEHVERHK